jgi:hypothetical protein
MATLRPTSSNGQERIRKFYQRMWRTDADGCLELDTTETTIPPRPDFRCGSKAEKLNASIRFPLFTQQQT